MSDMSRPQTKGRPISSSLQKGSLELCFWRQKVPGWGTLPLAAPRGPRIPNSSGTAGKK